MSDYVFGSYILEILTAGMYQDSRIIFRLRDKSGVMRRIIEHIETEAHTKTQYMIYPITDIFTKLTQNPQC